MRSGRTCSRSGGTAWTGRGRDLLHNDEVVKLYVGVLT